MSAMQTLKCAYCKSGYAVKEVSVDGETRKYSEEALSMFCKRKAKREEMGVPTDEETQSHVDFVQRALVSGTIENIDLKPNPGVQIKMGYKLALDTAPAGPPRSSEDYSEAVEFCDPHGLLYFADYAPKAFRKLREVLGIDENHYYTALCASQEYRQKLTEGKSYCSFYFVDDPCFMIKEVHPAEAQKLLGLVEGSIEHFEKNPHSPMVKILGLSKVRWHQVINGRYVPKDEWLIVMSNLFVTDIPIHRKWDIKGSLEGRVVSPEERAQPGFTLRDYDWDETEATIDISPELKKAFVEQLAQDTLFLSEQNVMDYSLLIGIHDENGPKKEVKSTIYTHRVTKFEVLKGGMPSTDGKKIYFIGLVDNLCEFVQKKYWENVFKSCLFESDNISSVTPAKYRERFLKCMERIFK